MDGIPLTSEGGDQGTVYIRSPNKIYLGGPEEGGYQSFKLRKDGN